MGGATRWSLQWLEMCIVGAEELAASSVMEIFGTGNLPLSTHTFARVILKATMLFKGLWACAGGLRGENELNWNF